MSHNQPYVDITRILLRDATTSKDLEQLLGPLHKVKVKNIKTERLYGKKNGLIERYITYA